jgi:tetraacyldisaccharide 4'-kinase
MHRLSILLRPFSWLYSLVLKLRHRLYDNGAFTSSFGPIPTVVVGNLELGGTGKSPMTDYLLGLLEDDFRLGLLSRGYGRSTKGFEPISSESRADDVGDEPLMLSLAHPKVTAAVCEDRLYGLDRILDAASLDLVVLDDAFQHRKLRSGFNVLVTPFQNPFWSNHLLPEGSLRDVKERARMAHAIIVSKCPENLRSESLEVMRKSAERYSMAPVHFANINYGDPVGLFGQEMAFNAQLFILLTGIADSALLENHLRSKGEIVGHLKFKDHHKYSLLDAQKLKEIYSNFAGQKIAVVTTAKDAVKLRSEELKQVLKDLPIFTIPIQVGFLSEGFDEMIKAYARANKRNS